MVEINELLAEIEAENGKQVKSYQRYETPTEDQQAFLEVGRNCKRISITLPIDIYLEIRRLATKNTQGNISRLITQCMEEFLA
ncbi:MAG: hypothetical protein ACRC80_19700 [Waterburya sp.]